MTDGVPQRIVSFLPSATEIAFALGLGGRVMGVTDECDYPAEATMKPVVIRSVLPGGLKQREIDPAVSERLKIGSSLYQADEDLLCAIAPDLILTQELCAVCAPSSNEVARLLRILPKKPEILWLTPKSLAGIFDNVRSVARATGRAMTAEALIAGWRGRLDEIAAVTRGSTAPRVFCMEWIDPIYCSGHWVPEMVRRAGGSDVLGREASDSIRVDWETVVCAQPEILVVMPCGLDLESSCSAAEQLLPNLPHWWGLPAVRWGRVFAVDANSYFARPGPRVIDGIVLLAHLFHPDRISWDGPPAYRKVACAK